MSRKIEGLWAGKKQKLMHSHPACSSTEGRGRCKDNTKQFTHTVPAEGF